jgi:hypothetical protein
MQGGCAPRPPCGSGYRGRKSSMGTHVEPFEYGLDCLTCFLPGRTPKTVKIVFEDIEACPGYPVKPPNNWLFTLKQHPGIPCLWYNWDFTDWYIVLTYTPDDSQLICNHMIDPTGQLFSSVILTPCVKLFNNQFTCASGDTFNGRGRVLFQPDNWPDVLANQYSFCPNPGTLFDRSPSADGGQVIKLANRRDKSNILIKVEN